MELISRQVSVMMIDDVETGAAFEEFRVKSGMSVKQAAAAADMSLAYLYALERGQRKWNEKLLKRLVQAVTSKRSKGSEKKSRKK